MEIGSRKSNPFVPVFSCIALICPCNCLSRGQASRGGNVRTAAACWSRTSRKYAGDFAAVDHRFEVIELVGFQAAEDHELRIEAAEDSELIFLDLPEIA